VGERKEEGEEGRLLRAFNKTSTPAACVRSQQLRVLSLGFFQDGDVGVGILRR
jgi:hypothetical protein